MERVILSGLEYIGTMIGCLAFTVILVSLQLGRIAGEMRRNRK